MITTIPTDDATLANRVAALAAKVSAKGFNLTVLSQVAGQSSAVRPDDRYALQAPSRDREGWWQCTDWHALGELETLFTDSTPDVAAFNATVKAQHEPRQRELPF